MNSNDYAILEFLSKQTVPIAKDNFPIQITCQYSFGLGRDSLAHALMVLRTKRLITENNRMFSITPDGITVLNDYKESIKKYDQPFTQIINVGRDMVGSGNFQSSLLDNDLANPITETHNSITPVKPPKRSVVEITAWIVGIIGGMIAIYEFLLKKFLH